MLPSINSNKKTNFSQLKLYQENPQTYNQNKSYTFDQYPHTNKSKSYQQMIQETDNLLQYLQQQQKPELKRPIEYRNKQHIRNLRFLGDQHKLIYENRVNMQRSTSMTNKQPLDNIETVSKIVSRKNKRTKTQTFNRQIQPGLVLVPKTKIKYLNLNQQLQSLRKLMHKQRAKPKTKKEVFKVKSSRINEKFTKRQKVQAMLSYDTVYCKKIKQQVWHQNASKLLEKNGLQKQKQKKQKYEYNIKFPRLSDIEKLIAGYIPLSNLINIDLLIREGNNYFRQYRDDEQKQYFYFGQHNQEKQRNGKGVLVTPVRIIQGIWDRGQIKDGVELQRKFKYKGKFHKNKRHGQGEFESTQGEKYKGQWIYNKKHGHGEWISQQGESYVGDWVHGKAEGYGTYKDKDGNKYCGQFHNFFKQGLGKQIFTNGDEFQGIFVQGFPHGKGKYIWSNGLFFEGRFVHGIRQGYGRLRKEGLFEFTGKFEKQKPIIQQNSVIFQSRGDHKKRYQENPLISLPRKAINNRLDDRVAQMYIPYNENEEFYETQAEDLTFTEISQ